MRKADLPVALFVAGSRKESLDPQFPERSLARLIAAQNETNSELSIKSWERRIQRWKLATVGERCRFLVVFDGLNEDAALPWSDILIAFAELVKKLGGHLVVTCRPAFWHRNISPRLSGALQPSVVKVPGYSDEELATLLRQSGRDVADFPERTKEFIRNPRVCLVALTVLSSSDIQADELTYERLLLSYWQVRLAERGNLIRHNAEDFKKLLSAHAKKWLVSAGGNSFATDDWPDLSGAAKREGLEAVRADLTEIEEGRFLTVVDESRYTFRPETLPFALGLLVADELKFLPKDHEAREAIHKILDPVAGFDTIGDILGAAVLLACADSAFPDATIAALAESWFSLQNTRTDTYTAIGACIRARPAAFFDAVELENFSGRHNWLADALVSERGVMIVEKEAKVRVPLWLGTWTRKSHHTAPGNSQVQRADERSMEIETKLMQLRPEERSLFEAICFEKGKLAPPSLINIAARFIADRPLAPSAQAFLARTLVLSVARDLYDSNDEIAWIFRLNRCDAEDTVHAIEVLGAPLLPSASPPMQVAILSLYRYSGSPKLGLIADDTAPIPKGHRWRSVENLCDVDPCDPNALDPSNLQNTIRQIGSCDQLNVRSASGTTSEDHTIETTTPSLSRFSINELVVKWREVIESLPQREQMSLRQLIITLPSLSPLFDEQSIKSLRATFDRLAADPSIVRSDELQLMINYLMMALVPHYSVHDQFELLQRAPDSVKEFDNLYELLGSLPCSDFEGFLDSALRNGKATQIRRVLVFAPSNDAPLTEKAKALVCECMRSAENDVAGLAMEVARANRADDLSWIPAEKVAESTESLPRDWQTGCRSRLIATIAVRQHRAELLKFVQPDELAWCCQELGVEGAGFYLDVVDCSVTRLLLPVSTALPKTTQLALQVSGANYSRRLNASEDVSRSTGRNDTDAFNADLSSDVDFITKFASRQEVMQKEVEFFYNGLANEGVSTLTDYIGLHEAVNLVERFPERVMALLNKMLHAGDRKTHRWVSNYAIPLASAFATRDESLCSAVFERYRTVKPVVNIYFYPGGVPLFLGALFATPTSVLDLEKRQVFDDAFTDAELELAIVSAERFGDHFWLDGYVNELCSADTAGDIARGLTIASLRKANPDSDKQLARTFGGRFLFAVKEHAIATYEKNEWAEHWFNLASKAADPVDFWRFGNLAEHIVDRRFAHWSEKGTSTFPSFECDLMTRFNSSAQKRSKKREETLFGLPAPSSELKRVLRSAG